MIHLRIMRQAKKVDLAFSAEQGLMYGGFVPKRSTKHPLMTAALEAAQS